MDSAVRIEEELLAYRLDFGFLEGNIRSSRLESVEFGSYRVGVYVSPAHPLALRPSCGPEELIRERLLLREKGSAVRDVFDHGLTAWGCQRSLPGPASIPRPWCGWRRKAWELRFSRSRWRNRRCRPVGWYRFRWTGSPWKTG